MPFTLALWRRSRRGRYWFSPSAASSGQPRRYFPTHLELGRLYRGRPGIGYLALRSGAPVIPVAMAGTREMLPPGGRLPRPRRVEVRVGRPMTFGDVEGLPSARARGVVADRVMAAIARLSGQQYVHGYARSVADSRRRRELSTYTVPNSRR